MLNPAHHADVVAVDLKQVHAVDSLEVGGGTQAIQIFCELLNPALSPARRASLRAALLGYCERDTLAMVKLTHFFRNGDA